MNHRASLVRQTALAFALVASAGTISAQDAPDSNKSAAILAEGLAETINVSVDREPTVARIRVDATSVQTERAVVEERLQETHFQHRLQILHATMTPESRSNRGLSIDVLIPVPQEAVA